MLIKSEEKQIQSYAGVDVFKFLLAFAVIAIHCKSREYTVGNFPPFINWLISMAVPFFFVTSGFLLARKLDGLSTIQEKKTILRNRSKQLFVLWGKWLLIYLPIAVYYLFVTSDKIWWRAIGSYMYNTVFFGSSHYAWPLWFIYSMAIICLIYSHALFKGRYTVIILLLAFTLISFIRETLDEVGIFNLLTARELGGGYSDDSRHVLISF